MQQCSTRDDSVTLYLNNISHIGASAKIKKSEDNIVQLAGIAPSFILGSLHPILESKKIEILEVRVLEPTTLEEIAKSQIGRKAFDFETHKDVQVLGVDNGKLIFSFADKVHTKELTKFGYDLQGIRSERLVELKLDRSGNETRELRLSYLSRGITLTPHYNIVLSGGKLVLEAEVEVENKTGKSFENIELETIPGDVRTPYLVRGESPRIERIETVDSLLMEFAEASVDVFEEGGQIGYSFGKTNLPEGDSRFSVFKIRDLEYKVVYKANVEGKRPEINAVLEFKTPITLPVGSVAVYGEKQGVRKEETIERYEGGGSIINPVLKDNKVDIALRSPDTLEMRVKQIGKTRIMRTKQGTKQAPLYALERKFEVIANNAGQEDLTIEAYLQLRETEKILTPSLKPSEERGRRIKWDVKVKAGGKTSFSYKTQNLQFFSMSYKQVKDTLRRATD